MAHRMKCRCSECREIRKDGPKAFGSFDLSRRPIHLPEVERILIGYTGEKMTRKQADLAERNGYHPVNEVPVYGNPTGANIPDGRVVKTSDTDKVYKSQNRNKNNWK